MATASLGEGPTIVQVEWSDPRAADLRRALDREMTERYTGRHDDDPYFARGASALILQTGDRQPDAVALYRRLGYRAIRIYDPYRAITNSLCFEKTLTVVESDAAGARALVPAAEVSAEA